MAQGDNALLPTQGTNKWRVNTGEVPPGLAPAQTQMFVKPGIDIPLAAPPITPVAAPAPAATFRPQPSAAALPPPAENPNTALTTNNVNGMSVEGGGQAVIDLKNGQINRNPAWRNMPVGNGQNGTTTGVGGSLNVMTPEQNAAVSNNGGTNFQQPRYGFGGTLLEGGASGGGGGGGGGNGEVWGGAEGQGLRQKISTMLDTATRNAVAPVGGANDVGHRAQWAQLSGHLTDILGGSLTAQGGQRAAMGELGLKTALAPSEIAKNVASAGYFGAHGTALEENAAARQQIANQQLQIAGLKAGAGKYGDTERNAETLKGHGFDASPQNLQAYEQGHTKYVPPVKAQGGMWRNLTGGTTSAIPGHMVDPSWTPVMTDGKQQLEPKSGLPVYKDLKGNMVTPDVRQ